MAMASGDVDGGAPSDLPAGGRGLSDGTACLGITRPTDGKPPLADAVHREGGRVMVDADTHPPGIRGQIIDAIGHRSAEFLDEEVVHPDLFRTPLRPILAAIVAEIADQFLP